MAEEIVDLFPGAPRQMGFDLGDAPTARTYEPGREAVRRELHDVLAVAKGANWLPEDERGFASNSLKKSNDWKS